MNCEMCGAETDDPALIKIEGAELEVCDNCSNMGTRLDEPEEEEAEETEEVDEPPVTGTAVGKTSNFAGQREFEQSRQGRDTFEDKVEELVYDYEERIKRAREQMGKTREEVANSINEKKSLLGRLENGKALPSEQVRRKLETELDIELTSKSGE